MDWLVCAVVPVSSRAELLLVLKPNSYVWFSLRTWFWYGLSLLLSLTVRCGFFLYPVDGFGLAYFGECPISLRYCIVLAVLDKYVPVTNSVYRTSGSYGLVSSHPSRLFFVSVLDGYWPIFLRLTNFLRKVSVVFSLLVSCLPICGCICLVRWFRVPFGVLAVL